MEIIQQKLSVLLTVHNTPYINNWLVAATKPVAYHLTVSLPLTATAVYVPTHTVKREVVAPAQIPAHIYSVCAAAYPTINTSKLHASAVQLTSPYTLGTTHYAAHIP